jgi:hemoglobin-like flavoprotein
MDSMAMPYLNGDPGAIITFPGETFGLKHAPPQPITWTMRQDDLTLFRLSLVRATSREDFFDSFYGRFMNQSKEIAGFFQHRDMSQLKKKLRETLQMVSESAEGRPGITLYLEMLGRIHDRLHVGREHFDMWQTALLETVAEYDEAFDERTRTAWHRIIGQMISQMFEPAPTQRYQVR